MFCYYYVYAIYKSSTFKGLEENIFKYKHRFNYLIDKNTDRKSAYLILLYLVFFTWVNPGDRAGGGVMCPRLIVLNLCLMLILFTKIEELNRKSNVKKGEMTSSQY